MRIDDLQKLQRAVRSARIQQTEPGTGSEYWLFAKFAATAESLLLLPNTLGLGWDYRGSEQLVVDFVDGPDQGESDLLSWPELVVAMNRPHRLMLRWSGCRLPLRVLLVPGVGVRLSIEHLDGVEFSRLHAAVIDRFLPLIVGPDTNDLKLIGCDTKGTIESSPEGLLQADDTVREVLVSTDFMLLSTEIWERRSWQLEPGQTATFLEGSVLLATLEPELASSR